MVDAGSAREDLGANGDARDEQELYARLMAERRRLQRQQDDKRIRKRTVRQSSLQRRSAGLEERERGFQLYVSGANEDRVEEIRRRQVQQREARRKGDTRDAIASAVGKEWQVETVQLRAEDGSVYRCSPHAPAEPHVEDQSPSVRVSVGAHEVGSADRDEIDEEIGEGVASDVEPEGSRPSTGASTASGVVDRETRSVLRLMHTANSDQLQHLRESLTGTLERRVPSSSPGCPPLAPPARVLESRGNSATIGMDQSRPSSSCSSAIANAIQAENARVKRFSEGMSAATCPEDALGSPLAAPLSASKAGRRLPLTAEVAAGCAPPSALSHPPSSISAPSGSNGVSGPPLPILAAHHQASASGYPSGNWRPPVRPQSGNSPGKLGGATPRASPDGGLNGCGTRPSDGGAEGSVTSRGSRDVQQELFDRVGRLDRRKQKALLRVLESLENTDSATHFASGEAGWDRCEDGGTKLTHSPDGAPQVYPSEISHGSAARELRIRVISNWGDPRQCGLSCLEMFDAASEFIRIPPASLSLQGTQSGSTTLSRIIERRGDAFSEKSMWSASVFPKASGGFETFEILLSWPQYLAEPAALRLWNFSCLEGLAKGVRDVEIFFNGDLSWSGEIPQGTGRNGVHSSVVLVPLKPDFELKANAADDQRLMESFRALEQFRASQSRRWFSEAKDDTFETPDVRMSPDLGLEGQDYIDADTRYRDGACNFEHREGGLPTTRIPEPEDDDDHMQFLAGQDVPFDGLDIMVRGGFDDNDALDSLLEGRPNTVMGSSLVATCYNPMLGVIIPTLPRGRRLLFNCVSTWGDVSFVGLAGIEIFDGHGFPLIMKDCSRQISADPESINVLPEYEMDPRTPDKLFDQVNLTQDDLHMWLTPFFAGRQAHTITADLERETSISMIRIWNYNKNRLHSSRGVRDMEILFDGNPVFAGEIRRAPGVLTAPEEACEHILFTSDESVLAAIERHDWLPEFLPFEDDCAGKNEVAQASQPSSLQATGVEPRPPTAGVQMRSGDEIPKFGFDGRPITRACVDRSFARAISCRSITWVIHSTWGDQYYVGLTAINVLNASLEPIPLQPDQVDASPRDLNDLEGVDDDKRTVDKVLDGVGCTMDDTHMWLAPFFKANAAGSPMLPECGAQEYSHRRNLLRIDFGDENQEVAGFNIWNYNKNVEGTGRGVREFAIFCDDRYIATFLCRKAPGHVNFDFKQVVLLDQPPGADSTVRRVGIPPPVPRLPSRSRTDRRSRIDRSASRDARKMESKEEAGQAKCTDVTPGSQSESLSRHRSAAAAIAIQPTPLAGTLAPQQQYETPVNPCGFVFKLLLLNTWSDPHYVGLDGVELLDQSGRPVGPRQVHSNHGSVRNLPGLADDIRTEHTFLRGAPGNSGRMWLAPFCRNPANSVEFVFDEPTRISCLRFWNYSRTPARGVRDIEIYVDDLLIYQGILRQAVSTPLPAGIGAPYGAVLFTAEPDIINKERERIYLPSAEELVTFFDETELVDQEGKSHGHCAHAGERPMTALVT